MTRIIIAALAACATFVATETANAQSFGNEQVINNLNKKADTWWVSEGRQTKSVVTEAGQKTYIYDRVDFEMSVPAIHNGRPDTLKVSLNKGICRNETSGVAGGADAGSVLLDKNFSVAFGGHITMAWKRLDITGGFLIASNKHTNESSQAGKSFITPMVYGELAYCFRFAQGGYNNMAYIAPFVGYACIFDKNQDYLGENTYQTPEGTVTESSYFDVEGKSGAIYGGVKYRTSLKHMGRWGLTVKVFGGVYNRYFKDGSRRKPFGGVTVGIEFSGAKKRVDSDVTTLQKSLENGDFQLANEFINNLRANQK